MALEQVSTRGLHWVSWDFASMDMSNSAYIMFLNKSTLYHVHVSSHPHTFYSARRF
jgi:hypothetical protein